MSTETPLRVLDYCTEHTWNAVVAQREAFLAEGGRLDRPINDAFHLALEKARQFIDLGSAYVDVQPGNMTSYAVFLHDLDAAQRAVSIAGWLSAFDEPTDEQRAVAEKMVDRTHSPDSGAAGRWGGPLLIAMPIRGASVACALMDFYHHSFLMEHLAMRYPDAVAVGEFLSLFGSAVQHMRESES